MSLILQECTAAWQAVIARAQETKREKFGKQAKDAMHFYESGDHKLLFDQAYMQQSMGMSAQHVGEMNFKTSINLTSNAVSVFLPVLYNRNPNRTVTPKQCGIDPELAFFIAQKLGLPFDPQKKSDEMQTRQLRASLFHHYLNATPRELNLKDQARLSILEAFVKGMGVLWAESFPAAEDETTLIGMAHDTIDNLLIDPDCQQLSLGGFIVRIRCEPIFRIERKFELKPGTLKDYGDTLSSYTAKDIAEDDDVLQDASQTQTCDSMTYYEIYSRIGLGSNLKQSTTSNELNDLSREVLDQFGDYVYLAIPAKSCGYEYPLNLPPELFEQAGGDDQLVATIKARIRWPLSSYADRSNPWPCAVLGFHPIPKSPWCKSHMTDTMGLQKCADWILSFLMNRVRINCRALMVVSRELEEEIIEKILHGGDMELLQIESSHPGTLDQIIGFIKMPEISADVWKVLMAIKQEIEDNTGVTELNMSARTSQQMRSAEEASLKRDILAVRPDDMANTVENWLAAAARLEAGAAAEALDLDSIARVFNEPKPSEIERVAASMPITPDPFAPPPPPMPTAGLFTSLWHKLVYGMPVDRIFGELEFSIESGSARKPNQQERIANVDEIGKGLLDKFWQLYQTTGNPAQLNGWLRDYAISRNQPDPTKWLFPDISQQIQAQQQAAQQQQLLAGPTSGAPGQAGTQPQPGAQGPPPGAGAPPELPPAIQEMLAAGMPGGMPMPMPQGAM